MREVRYEIDGESVAAKLWEPEDADAARGQVVLVHGLLSQAAEFVDLGPRLAERGFRVLGVDQRGFGASGGPRAIVTQARATADILGGVAWLRKDKPDLHVGLAGHSMGAVFTLRALAADPSIRAGVLAAPMRRVRDELGDAEFLMYRAAIVASQAKQRVGLGPIWVPYKYDYDRLFYDQAAAARAREQAFLVRKVSLGNAAEFLAMNSETEAANVRQPVLVILADYDRAVKRANSLAVYNALAGPKELATLACGHSMFGDCEAEAAADHVARWMEKHL